MLFFSEVIFPSGMMFSLIRLESKGCQHSLGKILLRSSCLSVLCGIGHRNHQSTNLNHPIFQDEGLFWQMLI